MLATILTGNEEGWWFVISDQMLWLPKGQIPLGRAEQWRLKGSQAYQIGQWQEQPVWLVQQYKQSELVTFRSLLTCDQAVFHFASRALQLSAFCQNYRFCHHCGQPMQPSVDEWAFICLQCNNLYYPPISPAIIVAIRDNDKLLLARHRRHNGMMSTVLAGFVEVGETLEQTVHREVMEETGLTITNLRYFGSQSWPFPHALMVAFLADYQSGDLMLDPNELLSAQWYYHDALPHDLPPEGTIARQLIETSCSLCQ